ncbi:MAG: response regulator transcription factor [Acidobacteriaceae bacterium]|nr:response regulator transcription factor [Acidobacteriaceae bacterium]MBV9038733.1 response regulator transcription factor [Acidobacteriaceae bacterium]MBV9307664.1 response regulator transcription factor [Acidobacteriaceae bacterium]MBV9938466.1 response regulator transcription factor [Acidobacteriaceae bacterium]
MKPQVLIADDHQLVLEGLKKLIETECDIVGSVSNGRDLVTAAKQLNPDIVLLDLAMPLLNGIEAARQIKADNPGVKLIFLTMQTNRDYVREAFEVGASGYVAKMEAASDLLSAIRDVQAGRFALSPSLSERLLGHQMEPHQNPTRLFSALTPRQREVLQLVAEGKSAKQIAEMLYISVKTVEFHKKHLMDELRVQNSAELVRYAVEQGWVHS